MAKDTNIPIAFLRQCFDHDADTGALTWRTRPREHFTTHRGWASFNAQFAGTEAGALHAEGYRIVHLTFARQERHLKAHRIIKALELGRWPEHEVDHANGVEAGNGVGNLREATHGQNAHNQKTHRNNSSGFPGVSPNNQRGKKWLAQIGVDGRKLYLGRFDTAEAAFFAHLDAKVTHHPFAPEPRGLSEAAAAVEAWWWFDRKRWRAIV